MMRASTVSRPLKGFLGAVLARLHPSGLPARTHSRDGVACILLLLLAILFPWQLSLLGQLPSSVDFLLQYYPNLAFLGNSLKAGELPLWNPYVFAGTPYLADPQSALLYLPNWPFLLLLDTVGAARAIVLFHYALASVSFYLYMRVIGLPRRPSFLGASIFGVSEYTITQVAGIPLLINLSWIPVVLLLLELTLQRRSVVCALGTAVALTMQLFNGWLHGLYITGFAILFTFLWHAIQQMAVHRSWRRLQETVGLGGLIGIVWGAMGSILLLPAMEFVGQSNYVMERGLERAGSEGNVTVLALLGTGGSEGHGAYIGMIGLLLALAGALFGRDRRRVWLFLLLGGFALLVAFGTKAPLYGHLYPWVPGFRTFHTPGRFMALYLLSASALAAFGADALLRGTSRRQLLCLGGVLLLLMGPLYYTMSRMFAPEALGLLLNNLIHWWDGPFLNAETARHIALFGVGGFLLLMVIGTGRISGRLAYALALGLLLLDLSMMRGLGGHYFSLPPTVLEANHGLAFPEKGDGQGYRVLGYARNRTLHFLSDFPYNLVPALMPPNLAMIYGLQDVQGYNPLQLRRYADYIAAVNGGAQDYHWALIYNLQSPLLDLLGLRYVALRGDNSRLQNVTIATGLNLESSGETLSVQTRHVLASGLQIHSYLGNSTELVDGQIAARVRVVDSSGGSSTIDLRAGIETAEWAYDRPDVVSRVKHSRAPISMTWNLPSPVHTYVAEVAFPEPIEIAELSLERVEPNVFITVPEIAAIPAVPLQRYQEVGETEEVKLYRNNLALPGAMLGPEAVSVGSPVEALEEVQRPDFDPRRMVVLEGSDRPTVGATGRSPLPDAHAQVQATTTLGEVELLSRSNNTVRLEVRTGAGGFLVLNELSYPGWNAYVDGVRTGVWRANYLFRAIEISPGDHEVEFRFEPDSLKLGFALSLSTLASLSMAAIWKLRRRQHRKESTP